MKITALCAFFGAVCSFATFTPAQQQQTLEVLARQFPGVRVFEFDGRVRKVYGVPMSSGKTSRDAAAVWLENFGDVFTGDDLTVQEHSATRSVSDKHVVTFKQTLHGVVVRDSLITLVGTASEGTVTLGYVSARVADTPAKPWGPPTVTAHEALLVARKDPLGAKMAAWSEPALTAVIVEDGKGTAPAVLVWYIRGSIPGSPDCYGFIIDAFEGVVVQVDAFRHYRYCARLGYAWSFPRLI